MMRAPGCAESKSFRQARDRTVSAPRGIDVRRPALNARLDGRRGGFDELAESPIDPGEDETMAKATMNRRPADGRPSVQKPASKHSSTAGKSGKPATGFSERKSIETLAAEQGVKPTKLEDILGKGADLWESDHEFERFVEGIYARRREDRELSKP